MRRVVRHLFTTLSAISLVISVAMCLLWARSYIKSDMLVYARVQRDKSLWTKAEYHIGSDAGRMMVGLEKSSFDPEKFVADEGVDFDEEGFSWHSYEATRLMELAAVRATLGFSGDRLNSLTDFNAPYVVRFYSIPLWCPFGVAAVIPIVWLRVRRRVGALSCSVCGYDLRVQLALGDQGDSNGQKSPARCPECGTRLKSRITPV